MVPLHPPPLQTHTKGLLMTSSLHRTMARAKKENLERHLQSQAGYIDHMK